MPRTPDDGDRVDVIGGSRNDDGSTMPARRRMLGGPFADAGLLMSPWINHVCIALLASVASGQAYASNVRVAYAGTFDFPRAVGAFGTEHRYAFSTSFSIEDGAEVSETTLGGTVFYGYSRSALTDVRIVFGTAVFGVDDILATSIAGSAAADFFLDRPILGGDPGHMALYLSFAPLMFLSLDPISCNHSNCTFDDTGLAVEGPPAVSQSLDLRFATAPAVTLPEPGTAPLIGGMLLAAFALRTRRGLRVGARPRKPAFTPARAPSACA